jgi:hypothetical protein
VQRTLIRPPSSRLGPLTAEERRAVIAGSPVLGIYDIALDRDSAHEMLKRKSEAAAGGVELEQRGEFRIPKRPDSSGSGSRSGSRRTDSPTQTFLKSLARSVGTVLPRILERVLRSRYRRR